MSTQLQSPLPPPGASSRRISRDDIVALARQGRHWDFIPLALRLLKQIPHDHAVRLLVATSYVRLGLPAASAEHLDLLPYALQAEPSVCTLRQVLAAHPSEEISVAQRAAICDANLGALSERLLDLSAARSAWIERTSSERWFVTRDSNNVRRAAGAHPDDPWLRFRNDRLEAESFPFPHLADPGKPTRPYFLEGIDPPWMLLKLYQQTPTAADGYRTRLTLVQESAEEFLDALACADLRTVLADSRVNIILGPDAGTALTRDLAGRAGTRGAGPLISLATTRRRTAPTVGSILEQFSAAQVAEHHRLHAQVSAAYAGRDRAWWQARYTTPAEPLRVLIPTCRYSTFIKHSASDLAEAFTAAGWSARILIEPDDTSHLASVAYLRELAEFNPDLVVLINYTRTGVAGKGVENFFPPNLPFVCWIQDAMPHQFDAAAGAAQGEYDFLLGYLHWELFKQFGFPLERAQLFPVAVSERKFHSGPVGGAESSRFECEIAYVSHHSETPDAMHRRLVGEAASKEPLAARIFEELRTKVESLARASFAPQTGAEARDAAREAARRVLGSEPPEATITLVTRQYCYPMIDRLLRHETLQWAARLAEQRNWRLHIHGKGWGSHPTLARYARPPLAHDEELREAYQLAAVHLHASSNWLLHQRVMECALSGGLPLSRLKWNDLVQMEHALLHTLAHEAPVVMERLTSLRYREYGFVAPDHPAACEYLLQRQRVGLAADAEFWIHGKYYDELRNKPRRLAEPAAAWLLGDLSQTTFHAEQDFVALVTRAVEDRPWRAAMSDLIASRSRRRYTTDALANVIRELVQGSFAPRPDGAPAKPFCSAIA